MAAHAIPARFRLALSEIYRILNDRKVTWALTGSLSFALQGVPVRPNDIDLQTDEAGAYEIEKRFAPHIHRPVSFSTTGRIRSHYGVLLIDGIKVDVIGDIEKRLPDGSWTPPPDLVHQRRFIVVAGFQIPVLKIEYEIEAYTLLGRIEQAQLLQAWLDG
jgi:hypothetical protein